MVLRIGIYGGSFNPPHIGHIRSAETASRQLGLDLLFIIPAGAPPHKILPDGTPSADKRFHMACLAFPDDIVSDIETSNRDISYSVDTVRSIGEAYPGADLFLLLGADMYVTLDTWRNSKVLLSAATPAVFSRGSADRLKIAGYSLELRGRYSAETITIENSVIEISSSQLREMLPARCGSRYIIDTIYAYIIKYRLYGAKPEWDWLRGRAHSMLAPSRIPHVDGCEREAVALAKRWGVDVDDAREAAILHDITKNLDVDGNLKILEESGIYVGAVAYAEEKLLHSKSGAELARSEFGVSDGVADAIRWHTTGRAGMSALEKVIYLADYIEPTRDFDGVGELRRLAYTDLAAAMKMGLEMSITDMVQRGIIPNMTTYDALGDL